MNEVNKSLENNACLGVKANVKLNDLMWFILNGDEGHVSGGLKSDSIAALLCDKDYDAALDQFTRVDDASFYRWFNVCNDIFVEINALGRVMNEPRDHPFHTFRGLENHNPRNKKTM
jgi:hypothetical protein